MDCVPGIEAWEGLNSTPRFVLSFDPGGADTTSAWCLSTLKIRSQRLIYTPIEIGFAPVVQDIAYPDLAPFENFRDNLLKEYPNCRIDLVAERFIARKFAARHGEYIPFSLGMWSALWKGIGPVRNIMASQWKQPLKRFNKKVSILPRLKRKSLYENWWEDMWADWLPVEEQDKGDVHKQDACAIGWWYWRWELGLDCYPEGVSA